MTRLRDNHRPFKEKKFPQILIKLSQESGVDPTTIYRLLKN